MSDPDGFWREQARRLDWIRPFTRVSDCSFAPGDIRIRWFDDGTLNVASNCIDRHLAGRSDQTAIIWEPDDPSEGTRHISYRELHERVSRFANVLKGLGMRKGDRVVIYLPMIPEAAYAMLACSRIGAIHCVVYSGYAPDTLANWIDDCDASLVITADAASRGGRVVKLKDKVNQALIHAAAEPACLVVRRTGRQVAWVDGRDHWLHEAEKNVSAECEPEEVSAEDPLFILYTSESAGRPRGVVHTSGGYLVYTAVTHQLVFDYHDGEVFWCASDVGWITGHSYGVYGPLANGATTLMFEGLPTHPDASRYWQICERHEVATLYTSPAAIHAVMDRAESEAGNADFSSLRLLGVVGGPLSPKAWAWYDRVVGHGRCPILEPWWQAETGGHLLAPLPGAVPTKAGSATLPFFGIAPVVLDPESGKPFESKSAAAGALCFASSWPGQARTLWNNHRRFAETYFERYPGYFFLGDGARRDADGYYWITDRIDDIIAVSGHRMGPTDIEQVLVAHEAVAEAAIVGVPSEAKGQDIYAFVKLMDDAVPSDALRKELSDWVRHEIGPIAKLDLVQWVARLPKTHTGRVHRRILREITRNQIENVGSHSELAEPDILDELIGGRLEMG